MLRYKYVCVLISWNWLPITLYTLDISNPANSIVTTSEVSKILSEV